MKRKILTGVIALSLVAGGAAVGAGATALKEGERDTSRSTPLKSVGHSPQDVISEDGVNRVFGANRYATAVTVSQAYGWDETTTIAVYIASGESYPDALGIGLSALGDGPLLLVNKNSIPNSTRAELERLMPCFIDVQGGTGTITDAVFDELKTYAYPEFCA